MLSCQAPRQDKRILRTCAANYIVRHRTTHAGGSMLAYPRLRELAARIPAGDPQDFLGQQVVPCLIDAWLDDYARSNDASQIVETTTSGFSYLFDIAAGRLLAAAAGYHRGHAIAHTLGGPTDINLVPQLGSVNVGPFRELERQAVATPGALYFTYWRYADRTNQTPTGVEQGLIVAGRVPDIRRHGN